MRSFYLSSVNSTYTDSKKCKMKKLKFVTQIFISKKTNQSCSIKYKLRGMANPITLNHHTSSRKLRV